MNKISPSQFYYFARCPYLYVLSKSEHKSEKIYKTSETALGSILHQFYENRNKWKIPDQQEFERMWNELVNEINREFQENEYLNSFFPIQYNVRNYAVKKALMRKMVLSADFRNCDEKRNIFSYRIEDEILSGTIDHIVLDSSGNPEKIIDLKTGSFSYKGASDNDLNEVYRMQLGLYAKMVFDKFKNFPSAFITDLCGNLTDTGISPDYCSGIYKNAEELVKKTESADITRHVNLARPDESRCLRCRGKYHCSPYHDNLINVRFQESVDLKGTISAVFPNGVVVSTKTGNYTVTLKRHITKTENSLGKSMTLYNLYYPASSSDHKVYETVYTVLHHEMS